VGGLSIFYSLTRYARLPTRQWSKLLAKDEQSSLHAQSSPRLTRSVVDASPLQGIRAELLSTINNPTKMNAFLDRLGHNPQLDQRKMRIVFNLDNTLVTLPADPADYSSVRPVADMVDLVCARPPSPLLREFIHRCQSPKRPERYGSPESRLYYVTQGTYEG